MDYKTSPPLSAEHVVVASKRPALDNFVQLSCSIYWSHGLRDFSLSISSSLEIDQREAKEEDKGTENEQTDNVEVVVGEFVLVLLRVAEEQTKIKQIGHS